MARQMKDSGVDWIGKIPEEWEVRKIAQFWKASKGPNAALLTAEYCGEHSGQYPVYSGQTENNGVMGMIDSYIFDFGTAGCLFSTTVGAKAMSVSCLYGKFSLSQNCMIMQPITDNCDVRYFFYLFTFIFGYYRSLIPDNMQPSFRVKDFYAYSMLMLSEIEQKEIASYLDTKCAEIDKVVEQTRATIEEYKKLKQAIITEAVTKGVRGPRPMKPSGVEWIGDIPEEWRVSRIKDMGKCSNGISKSGEYFGTGAPFITYKDVYDNFSIITPSGLVESSKNEQLVYSVEKGDIFFTRTSETIEEIGFSSVCCRTIPNATFAGFLIRFRPQKELLYCGYSKYYFRSSIHRSFFNKEMNLVTRASLSQTLLKKLSVLLPQYREQQEIATYLDAKCAEIGRIIEKKEQLIEELGSYKKSLIYEYVTGKKEVTQK